LWFLFIRDIEHLDSQSSPDFNLIWAGIVTSVPPQLFLNNGFRLSFFKDGTFSV
jgi:hypothetical protein